MGKQGIYGPNRTRSVNLLKPFDRKKKNDKKNYQLCNRQRSEAVSFFSEKAFCISLIFFFFHGIIICLSQ